MKQALLTILRDRETSTRQFRAATNRLTALLAAETTQHMDKKEIAIQTPLATTGGAALPANIVLIPVLRAGQAMLPGFLRYYPDATVGMMGVERDEQTFKPKQYYKKFPTISGDETIIVLDPMLATGGSVVATIQVLIAAGAREEKVLFTCVVAAPEGMHNLRKHFPNVQITTAAVDEKLNAQKYIVPGIGDFGDRYFGT